MKHGNVCARTRVWLNVGIRCTEQRLGALDSKNFRTVNKFTATVVSLAGVALRVLVGQHTALSL